MRHLLAISLSAVCPNALAAAAGTGENVPFARFYGEAKGIRTGPTSVTVARMNERGKSLERGLKFSLLISSMLVCAFLSMFILLHQNASNHNNLADIHNLNSWGPLLRQKRVEGFPVPIVTHTFHTRINRSVVRNAFPFYHPL